MLDIVRQRVMAQQGGFIRGQVEQRRTLGSALQLLRLAVFHISVIRSPRLRGAVRKGMGGYSISDLADLFPVSKPTVYRTLNRHDSP